MSHWDWPWMGKTGQDARIAARELLSQTMRWASPTAPTAVLSWTRSSTTQCTGTGIRERAIRRQATPVHTRDWAR